MAEDQRFKSRNLQPFFVLRLYSQPLFSFVNFSNV